MGAQAALTVGLQCLIKAFELFRGVSEVLVQVFVWFGAASVVGFGFRGLGLGSSRFLLQVSGESSPPDSWLR